MPTDLLGGIGECGFKILLREEVRLAKQNEGRNSCLVQCLNCREIFLDDRRARIDQHDTEIALREVCAALRSPGSCQGTEARRVNEDDPVGQPWRRDFHHDPRDALDVTRIALFRNVVRQCGNFEAFNATVGERDGQPPLCSGN